jgi:hypothetical protein
MRATLEREPSGGTPDPKRPRAFAPRIVHDVLASPGRPLDVPTRERFEPTLGHDFARVRVHDDSRAARSADAVGALAYTVGDHIVLGRSGLQCRDHIFAHELAHAAQQPGASASPGALPIGDLDSPSESAARDAAQAAMTGRKTNVRAGSTGAVLQRQPKPDDSKPPATAGKADEKKDDDEPTPWLTLQAQGLFQYSRVYTIPKPPPWLVGGQLAANFQFHSGARGFELALLGQYGRILTKDSDAAAPGDQWQVAVQPSWLIINTGSAQVALFGQGGYGATSSKDPSVAGQQFSLIGGVQATKDLFPVGPLKIQGVASLGGGGVWAKGPEDDKFSGSKTWQVSMGIQISLDAVKRKKPLPPPPEKVEVKLPAEDQKKPEDQTQKDTDGQNKKAEEEAKKKVAEETKKVDQKPPLPSDAKVFFLKDKPLIGLPEDKNVIAADMNGADLKALKSQVQATLAADPSAKISFIGYASIEGPDNCKLGARRSEWLRIQLGVPIDRVADPSDKSEISGNCLDDGGIVSFGSVKAVDTKAEAERKADRFAIVHFHRK